jgi:hypothetical protein
MRLLLLYAQALITQITMTAVCNRNHTVEQQVPRWLLRTMDTLDPNSISITQKQMAAEIGVRRGGVTEALGEYQRPGFVSVKRGKILVLNRPALARSSCECYAVIRNEFERLYLNILHGDPDQVLGRLMPNGQCHADCHLVYRPQDNGTSFVLRSTVCRASCQTSCTPQANHDVGVDVVN